MSALVAAGLTRRLGGRAVVSAAGFSIEAGETVALRGPSGCGKTTLLQMLGLLDRPDAGTVTVDGRDAWAQSAAARAALRLGRIGFVFQQHNLIDHLSARDNVALPAWRAGGGRRAAYAAADRGLEQIGLAARGGERAGTLSIGEAQRVAVARALVNRPLVLLADEPTGSLDAEAAALVLDALFGAGVALVVVTHDPEVASRAGRTLHMRDGTLAP